MFEKHYIFLSVTLGTLTALKVELNHKHRERFYRLNPSKFGKIKKMKKNVTSKVVEPFVYRLYWCHHITYL